MSVIVFLQGLGKNYCITVILLLLLFYFFRGLFGRGSKRKIGAGWGLKPQLKRIQYKASKKITYKATCGSNILSVGFN